MGIQPVELRKLVKIVRQYEVIYGGGISTSDAAIREECELLVQLLESELGLRPEPTRRLKAGGARAASLAGAAKKPLRAGFPKPTQTRPAAQAKLEKPEAAPRAKQAAAPTKKATSSGRGAKEPPASGAKAAKERRRSPESRPSKASEIPAKAGARKARVGARAAQLAAPEGPTEGNDVLKDLRSRHIPALKASAERAERIADSAEDDRDAERKHSFAALHLFDAFTKNKLPKYGGYIVCVRFVDDTGYTIIEIIGYENLQDIYPEGDTLVFKSVGCKLFAVVEPGGYLLKSVEPVNRPNDQLIPYRFSELARITSKRFQSVLIGRKPVFMPASFSVFKPAGEDLAILFYDQAEVYASIQDFIIMILRDKLGLPAADARKAAEIIARGTREFRLWMDEA